MSAVRLGEDEGRVRIGGAERRVRPGDVLEGYRVASVDVRRIVLVDPAGDGFAIVTFDPGGRGTVTVFRSTPDGAARPPEVR
jgi:hypothetical protein